MAGSVGSVDVAVVIGVVALDERAVVAAALHTDGVEDHAEVFGFDLAKLVTQALENPAAVAHRADHGDHAVHAWGQADGFRNNQQRTTVEDDMIVLFQGALDEIDEQLALKKFGGVGGFVAEHEHGEIGDAGLANGVIELIGAVEDVSKAEVIIEVENLVKLRPAEIGVDEQNAPSVEREAGGEVACDGGLPVPGAAAGHENAARGVERGGVLQPGANLAELLGDHGMGRFHDEQWKPGATACGSSSW